jgi:hypothetical protein
MPPCAPASPAVVIVCIPSITDSRLVGTGIGSQRSGEIGISHSSQGAERHKREPVFLNRPQCLTVGRMRYNHERSFVARGAVKGQPLICSA